MIDRFWPWQLSRNIISWDKPFDRRLVITDESSEKLFSGSFSRLFKIQTFSSLKLNSQNIFLCCPHSRKIQMRESGENLENDAFQTNLEHGMFYCKPEIHGPKPNHFWNRAVHRSLVYILMHTTVLWWSLL